MASNYEIYDVEDRRRCAHANTLGAQIDELAARTARMEAGARRACARLEQIMRGPGFPFNYVELMMAICNDLERSTLARGDIETPKRVLRPQIASEKALTFSLEEEDSPCVGLNDF